MQNKNFHFLSGLPRSGSTVLSAILNQNPSVYVTPTSPLVDQLISNHTIWNNLQTVKANPIPQQLDNITREIIHAMWAHETKPIIIDKNRGWGKNMLAANYLFEKDMKMVATVRDIPSIMASWLTLMHRNSGGPFDQMIMKRGLPVTDDVRLDIMWKEMVADCVDTLNTALRTSPNNIILVHYDELVLSPKTVLSNIEDFLQLPPHTYDINNINTTTKDDDLTAWGFNGMHTINSKLEKTSKSPKEILGDVLYDKYNIDWHTK